MILGEETSNMNIIFFLVKDFRYQERAVTPFHTLD